MPLRLAEWLATSQKAHPWRYLIIAAVVTAAAGFYAAGIVFNSSYEALLPEGAPEIQNVDAVRERTGGTRQLIVALSGGTEQARLDFGRRVRDRLEQIETIRYVDFELPIEFFRPRALWLLEAETLDDLIPILRRGAELTKSRDDPTALKLSFSRMADVIQEGRGSAMPTDGVMRSDDGRYVFVVAIPAIKFSDMDVALELMHEVHDTVASLHPEAEGIEARYAGNIEVLREQHVTMGADLRNASILAMVLGFIIIAGFTRRLAAPFVVGTSLLAGVAWTFAIARLIVGHLNIITGFLVAVLIGLGVDFGIHLYIRYRQEVQRDGSVTQDAVVRFVSGTFPPALTSALTTAGTFLSFSIAEFRGFSEFGLIAGVGVIMTLLSSFLVLPPLLVVTGRREGQKTAKNKAPKSKKRGTWTIPRGGALAFVALFGVVAAYGAASFSRIPFRNNFAELRGRSDATDFFEYVNENMGTGFNPAVFLAGSLEDARRIDAIVERLVVPEGVRDPSKAGRSLAVNDFIPEDVERRRSRINALAQVLADPELERIVARDEQTMELLNLGRQMGQAEPWGFDDLPEEVSRRFVTISGQEHIVYVWPSQLNSTDHEAAAWQAELYRLSERLDQEGISHAMADETLIVAWIYSLIRKDGPRLLIVAALVVLIFLVLDFRDLRAVLLVATPLTAGMLVFAAVMKAAQLELNMFNIIVVPSVIGIGIDNAVHIFHRYRAEGPGSVAFVLRNTGVAALLASMTTAAGFGSSLISHQTGLRTMGFLAVIGISCTFVAAVVFFPAVLTLVEMRRQPQKKGSKAD